MASQAKTFITIGVVLALSGIAILLLTFFPMGQAEIRYATRRTVKAVEPVDREFGIVIPKIGANARVIANVDPYNSREYQDALTRGVAHARGTAVPGAVGNVFLFAHSSEDFYNALRYNAVFYLINKLEPGDEIDLYYRNTKFVYRVTGKKIVGANDVSYLRGESAKPILTLMTCWPPGTTLKRILVFGELTSPK